MPAFYQDQFPTEYALHQKYAQSPLLLDLVWMHGAIVADICQQLVMAHTFDASGINHKIMMQACLLHDVGVYLCEGFEWLQQPMMSRFPYVQHSIVGAWILYKEQYLPEIVQAAYTHKGAGITTDDIAKLGLVLPLDNYLPETLLTQLICYASKYHSKAPKWRTAEEIVKSLEKYGSDKSQIFAKWYEFFGPVDMEAIKKKYQPWHLAITSQIGQFQVEPLAI